MGISVLHLAGKVPFWGFKLQGQAKTWQSMRSVMPPCPGMESPKSLILKLRLKPDAKKPPKGAMMLANMASTTACTCARAQLSGFRASKPSNLLHALQAMQAHGGCQIKHCLSKSTSASTSPCQAWSTCTATRVHATHPLESPVL